MRKHKYRALYTNPQTRETKMVYGDLVHNRYINSGMPEFAIESREDGVFTAYSIDHKTIGEFTGLPDKNGKEIYEGDIIEYTGSEIPGDEHNIELVEWNEDYPGWILGSYALGLNEFFKDELEVIGNIHQNKDLL